MSRRIEKEFCFGMCCSFFEEVETLRRQRLWIYVIHIPSVGVGAANWHEVPISLAIIIGWVHVLGLREGAICPLAPSMSPTQRRCTRDQEVSRCLETADV